MSFYERRAVIKIKQATMNHIPDASNLSKGMAHYWFELAAEGDSKKYFLFCQTSDQRIFHATKPQLMEFINSKNNSSQPLLLKPWDLIGVNGQKRTRTGKPKGEEEEEKKEEGEQKGLPKKKKQKVVVLPAPLDPILPELPFEILTMILDGMAEPKPAVRRFIFDALKGSTPNIVSFHLSNSRTIWKWYREIFDRKPPLALVQLEIYYKQRGDLNGFARRWYSGFVLTYDIAALTQLWRYYNDEQPRKIMKEKFTPTIMYMIMMHLRGKTIGFEEHIKDTMANYEIVEIQIRKALDILPDMPLNRHLPKFIMHPLKDSMLNVSRQYDKKNITPPLFMQLAWRRPETNKEDKDWFLNVWSPSDTRRLLNGIINQTLKLCENGIRTIRGIGPEQKFSVKDITAYVWLNQVIMRLFYLPLERAMESDGFDTGFGSVLREEVRLRVRSKQQQIAEDKLSVEDQEAWFYGRSGNYQSERYETRKAWKKKWRRPKGKGKEKEEKEEEEEEEEMSSSTSTSSRKIETIQFWN